jgi:hypothetical protein
MNDPRRSRRDAGLAAVNRWTRGAVAGGVVLAGVLGAGLAHLLPGQAAPVRHDVPSPARSAPPGTDDDSGRSSDDSGESSGPAGRHHRDRRHHRLVPPSTPPSPTHASPHATSGGS